MPKHKYREPTNSEILTALTLEARRRGLRSYGELQKQIDQEKQQAIVNAYIAQKDAKKEKKERYCKGCVYYSKKSAFDGVHICNFYQTGRIRRKDGDGNCREFSKKKKKAVIHTSAEYRLLHENWADKTVPEIARELGIKEHSVYCAMTKIRRNYGVEVRYAAVNTRRTHGEASKPVP